MQCGCIEEVIDSPLYSFTTRCNKFLLFVLPRKEVRLRLSLVGVLFEIGGVRGFVAPIDLL